MNIFVDGRMESNAAPVQDEGPTARVIVDGEDESGGGGGGKNAIQGVSVAGTPITPDDNKVVDIPAATTAAYGVVKLSTATNSTSQSLAATASAVKLAYDKANQANNNANGRASLNSSNTFYGSNDFSTYVTFNGEATFGTPPRLQNNGAMSLYMYDSSGYGGGFTMTGGAYWMEYGDGAYDYIEHSADEFISPGVCQALYNSYGEYLPNEAVYIDLQNFEEIGLAYDEYDEETGEYTPHDLGPFRMTNNEYSPYASSLLKSGNMWIYTIYIDFEGYDPDSHEANTLTANIGFSMSIQQSDYGLEVYFTPDVQYGIQVYDTETWEQHDAYPSYGLNSGWMVYTSDPENTYTPWMDTEFATKDEVSSLSSQLSNKANISHTHAASAIVSGTIADARIPGLAASKITSGTFDSTRVPGLRYALVSVTPSSGVANLNDLSVNSISVTANTALRMPAAVSGRTRDTLAYLTVTAGQTVSFAGPGGASATFKTDDGDLPDVSAGGTFLMRFTELSSNTFMLQSQELVTAS